MKRESCRIDSITASTVTRMSSPNVTLAGIKSQSARAA